MNKLKNIYNTEVNSQIVSFTLKLFTIAISILGPISLFRAMYTGWLPVYNIHIVLLVTTWIVFLFRKNISEKIITNYVIGLITAIIISALYNFGLLADGMYLIFFIPVLCLFIYNKNAAYAILGVQLLIIVVFCILYSFKIVAYNVSVLEYVNNGYMWIIRVIIISLISYWIINTLSIFKMGIERNNALLQQQIEELKIIESKLLKSEAINSTLINVLPGIFYMYDINGDVPRLVRWNKNLEALYDYTPEDLLNKPLLYFMPKEEHKRAIKAVKTLEEEKYISLESSLLLKDGSKVPYIFNAIFLEQEGKKYYMGVGIDISERNKAIDEIKRNEQNFRNIFNQSKDGIIISNMTMDVLDINNSLTVMTGYTYEEAKKHKATDFICKKYLSSIQDRIERIKTESIDTIEIEILHKSGQLINVEINSGLIKYEGETAILTIVRDISERKRMHQDNVKAIITAEEEERNNIAKEIHDGLGPILSTGKLYLKSYENINDISKQKEIIDLTCDTIDEALSSIKEISNNLSPHILQNYGYKSAVKTFCRKFEPINDVNINLDLKYSERFQQEKEIALYRVTIELINNSVKYSKANNINIDFHNVDNSIIFKFTDDGIGFDKEKILSERKGFGLMNMENRINSLQGDFTLITKPGKGVMVLIKIEI